MPEVNVNRYSLVALINKYTSSATESTFIFFIMWARWNSTVFMLSPSSRAMRYIENKGLLSGTSKKISLNSIKSIMQFRGLGHMAMQD